jgi:hypothetical protein
MKAHRLAALAAILVVGSVTPAFAIPVTYTTTGRFTSSNSNVFTQGGAQITFNALTATISAPPDTNAIFGSFTTGTLPASSVTLMDTFTLTITQSAPVPGGSVSFTSTVGGSIFLGNSQAFVQFNGPLTQTITTGDTTTIYRIVEGDDATLGRVELFPNQGDISSINGEVSVSGGVVPIPEPGTMALACIALPLLGLGYVRNHRRRTAQV